MCSSCLSLGFECEYVPTESSTNVIADKEYMSDLDQRTAALELVLQRLGDLLKGHLPNKLRATVLSMVLRL